MREERPYLRRAHRFRMALAVEQDVAPNRRHIRRLRSNAVVPNPNGLTQPTQKRRFLMCHSFAASLLL